MDVLKLVVHKFDLQALNDRTKEVIALVNDSTTKDWGAMMPTWKSGFLPSSQAGKSYM